jgi:Niemann-Pick C1 protein
MLTLGEIGPSVSLGCFTTFLGVVPLALAKSAVFRVFLKMFISIVLVGGSHGLIVLPVILSFIGPSLARKAENDVADEELVVVHGLEEGGVRDSSRGPEYAQSL